MLKQLSDRDNTTTLESRAMARTEWGDISVSKDGKALYLHILKWPESGTITVTDLPAVAASAMYPANGNKANFVQEGAVLKVTLPAKPLDAYDTVIKVGFTQSIGEQ